MNNSLDKRIIVNIDSLLFASDTISTYEIIDTTNPSASTTIFSGNTFVKAGTTTKSFDITDIIRNYRWMPDVNSLPNTTNANYVEFEKNFTVRFGGRESSVYVVMAYEYPHYLDYMESGWGYEGFFITQQGNVNNKPLFVPHYPMVSTKNYHLMFLLRSEGAKRIDEEVITDAYKKSFIFETDAYDREIWITQNLFTALNGLSETMTLSYNATTDLLGAKYIADEGRIDFQNSQTWGDNPLTSVVLSLKKPTESINIQIINTLTPDVRADLYVELPKEDWDGIYKGDYYFMLQFNTTNRRNTINFYPRVPSNVKSMFLRLMYLTPGTGSPNNTYEMYAEWLSSDWVGEKPYRVNIGGLLAAYLDDCPAPYYLQWQDRMGSVQSQPFNGKYEYSEDFERQHIKDYRERTRLSNINISSKWQLNTNWIDEKLYPFYESIFTSPFLKLYDVANDKCYDVIATGDWVEKRHNRDTKLINLNLELENNTTQNIIY